MRREPVTAEQPGSAGLFPSDDEIVRRTYELMVRRAGDPVDLFRKAEADLLVAAAQTVCRRFPPR